MRTIILKNKLAQLLGKRVVNFVFKINALTFREAKTKKDLENVYKLRYKVYLEKGYIKPQMSCRFTDIYDLYSVNFLVNHRKRPIGTVRLILNSPVGFWTEHLFNFDKLDVPRDAIAEVSRLAVEKKFRGGNRLVMLGLIKIIYDYTKRLNIDYLYLNVPTKLAEYFESFGIIFQELKEKPPTKKNLDTRKLIQGYFDQSQLKPYFVDIKQVRENFYQ